jgi:hypothetical protein
MNKLGKSIKFGWNLFKFIAITTGSIVASKAAFKGLKTSFETLADDIDENIQKIKEA